LVAKNKIKGKHKTAVITIIVIATDKALLKISNSLLIVKLGTKLNVGVNVFMNSM